MRTNRPHILRTRNKRGSVLFLTLLFLVLINLFAVAYWKLVPVELHSAKRHQMETEAYFASDAGVVDCLGFLEDVAADGNLDNFFNNNGVVNGDGHLVLSRSGDINGWTWEAEIIPGPETFGHNDTTVPNPKRVYKIEAVAKRPGITGNSQQYRKITTWVKQKSFIDKNWGNMAGVGNLYLFMDTFRLDGDYHTNGKAILLIDNSNYWNQSEPSIGGDLTFADPVENPSLGMVDGVEYSNWGAGTVPYHTSGANETQPRDNRYDTISGNGRSGVKSVQALTMPENTDSVAFGVWGDTPPTGPLTNAQKLFGGGGNDDLSLALNGAIPGDAFRNGIYIDDEVAQIEFSTTSAKYTDGGDPSADDPSDDNQIIRIYRDDNTAGPRNYDENSHTQSENQVDGDPNKYVEITHVTGRNFTIPPGATVVNGTHPVNTTLFPTDNDNKGWTVVRNASTNEYAIFKEQGNGAIYCSQDIEGVRGIVKGRRTVAVATDTGNSTANDHSIIINGDLLYAGTPAGDPPAAGGDTMLGLIGYSVRMRGQGGNSPTDADPQFGRMFPRRNQTTISDPNYLYTSIFAGRNGDPNHSTILRGGGFGSMDPRDNDFGNGRLYVFGSITEGVRQHKGTGSVAGNGYEFHEDENLDNFQPPFFPALPQFEVLSWEEKSVFSY
jgi:hypothetical protein